MQEKRSPFRSKINDSIVPWSQKINAFGKQQALNLGIVDSASLTTLSKIKHKQHHGGTWRNSRDCRIGA
jgi:hypothetical protein